MTDDDLDLHEPEHDHLLDLDDDLDGLLEEDAAFFEDQPDDHEDGDEEADEYQSGLDDEDW
ncbi:MULTISPECIES: hypothetical protein [Pseudomonas]|uniref:Uncharacterized protein n=1 Tax=Pseudomonas nitroreducens TaxID=46680 RepID=A0A6G6IQ12_PSENT|nr:MULTISPECIES: hypothetical protein [Pseudomonas]MBG6287616.1 hypothetical protein [Pseudomonas nitroreducens]MCJ1878865.1 hypothetical protein [Pseudomonas nitroreducens]MCJ1896321.1 hypothetical protein [Pseudomonas nitroreducens]MDG9852564.1 hypothetical protein [Pseudomonas nitroreducens]NMZ59762.1 hypothetical protein [Pseudomonas nitroreducens]